jgi:hypothetical protein
LIPVSSQQPLGVETVGDAANGEFMQRIFSTESDTQASDSRLARLQDTAYNVRQHAISAGGDLAGWRLARTMRDANSFAEASAAEHNLSVWLQARALDRAAVAR